VWAGIAAMGLVASICALWPAARALAAPALLFALVYICSGLIEFLHYYYRGLSRSDVESSLVLWQRLGTLAFAIAALAWRPDLTTLALAMLLPVAVTLAVSLRIALGLTPPLVVQAFPPPLANDSNELGWTRRSAEGAKADRPAESRLAALKSCTTTFRREVFPIGVGVVISAVYFRIDVFLVQWWSGSEAVGLYNAVFRLIDALRLFPAAVMAVVLPSLVRATGTRPLQRVSVAVLAFSIPLTALLWVTAGWIVPLLYGEPYAAAVPAFRILSLCLPLFSFNYALTHQLIGWNGERAYAAICAGALVVNLALNARLIPVLSIEGAAWATFWTEVVLSAGCMWALWARHGVRGPQARSEPQVEAVSL